MVRLHGRRRGGGIRIGQVPQVPAQRGVGQHHQRGPGIAGVLDDGGDPPQRSVQIATEGGRDRGYPDQASITGR
jgi:hypothetical protein